MAAVQQFKEQNYSLVKKKKLCIRVMWKKNVLFTRSIFSYRTNNSAFIRYLSGGFSPSGTTYKLTIRKNDSNRTNQSLINAEIYRNDQQWPNICCGCTKMDLCLYKNEPIPLFFTRFLLRSLCNARSLINKISVYDSIQPNQRRPNKTAYKRRSNQLHSTRSSDRPQK